MCRHLEQIVNPGGSGDDFYALDNNKRRGLDDNIEKGYYESGAGYVIPPGIQNRSYEFQFRRKLEKAGLEPISVDLLVLKYVYSMTLGEISEELGIISALTAHKLFKDAIAILKKKGFGK